MKVKALLFSALVSTSLITTAQINIPASGFVSENFNGMAGGLTLPTNWKVSAAGLGATANWADAGNATSVTQAANSGTPTTGGSYNWGTTAGTDRAVGFMTTGSYATPNSVTAFYRNTTGATITSLTLTFQVERYVVNNSTFYLQLYSSTNGSTWASQSGGDISAAVFTPAAGPTYTFVTPQTVYKSITIAISIANNADIYFRWVFSTNNTNSQGLGLDNVALNVNTANPVVTGSLTDGVTTPVKQGDPLTYTATINNKGKDATGVNYNAPLDANTTLNGAVRSSALANDDSYNTPLNTALIVSAANGVLVNDFGLPSPTVVGYGNTENPGATTPTPRKSDNNGDVTLNADGSFTYTPATGFVGYDRFAYTAHAGVAPDDIGIVTIAVGVAASAGTAESFPGVIGNVAVNNAPSLTSNDAGDGIAIAAVSGNPVSGFPFNTTSTNGGNVTMNANGTFVYNPPPGYEGSDNFTYTIDNGFSSPQTVTVNITIAGMIWFINNNAAAGDGRLLTPFNSIASYTAAAGANPPAVNDFIFVYESVTDYTGALTLLNGQKLIGQDATLALTGAGSITGYTVPSYSTGIPSMNSGNGTIVNLTSAANAVTLNSLNGSNLLRGFTIGNRTNSAINGTSFGTLTVSDLSIGGTGQALNLTSGSLNATFNSISSSGNTLGIALSSVNGSLTVNGGTLTSTVNPFVVGGGNVNITYSGNITHVNNSTMISVNSGHTGTITFQTGTLSATQGSVLQFDNADGTYNFNGTTTLGGSQGVLIQNGSAGTFTFGTGTSITAPVFTAFDVNGGTANITYSGNITQANNAAMVRVMGGHSTGTITFQTGTLNATNGTGLQFDNADGTYNFNGTTTLNGGDAGIDLLNDCDGTFTFNSNTSITNPAGTGFNIGSATVGSGGSCAVDYNGTISKTSAGRAIEIQQKTAGIVSFDGTVSGTTSSTGINLATNTGATINFTGGVTLNGIASVFSATGGGTINVTGSSNNIGNTTAPTATALTVTSTNIGASNLNFVSISENGGTNGIVLNNTGSGRLIVAGTGTASSGGTIQNCTNYGISLTNTTSPSFNNMTIQNISRNGVFGTGVVNFSYTNGTVSNTGTGAAGQYEENSMAFVDAGLTQNTISGTVTITGNTINQPRRNGIMIETWNGTISSINISSNTMTGGTTTADIQDAIHVFSQGNATQTAHITTGTFNNNTISGFEHFDGTIFTGGNGIRIAGGSGNTSNNTTGTIGAAATPIEITGNDIDNMGSNAIAVSFNGQQGISNFNIHNNGTVADPMSNVEGLGISVFFGGSGTFSAAVNNNAIDNNGPTVNAGSSGIGVQLDDGPDGLGNATGSATITVNNNSVANPDGFGIRGIARASKGTLFLKIQNNTVGNPSAANRNGIRVDAGSSTGDVTLCLNMTGNTAGFSGVNQPFGIRKQGTVSTVNDFGINGLSPAIATGAQAAAKISADNGGLGCDVISGDNYVNCTNN